MNGQDNQKKIQSESLGIETFYDELVEYEWERLARHKLEWLISTRVLKEYLPKPPAKLLDLGGGPGRYALWLAEQNYEVTLADISTANLKFASQKAAEKNLEIFQYRHVDARDLSTFKDETFDAVLFMGPLYHLVTEEERVSALQEVWKKVKPGGYVFAAFITRYAPFIDGAAQGREWILQYKTYAMELLQTGIDRNFHESTMAYFSHPGEIEGLVQKAGFHLTQTYSCEGFHNGHEEHFNSLNHEDQEFWVELNYKAAADPYLYGSAAHLLSVLQKLD